MKRQMLGKKKQVNRNRNEIKTGEDIQKKMRRQMRGDRKKVRRETKRQ